MRALFEILPHLISQRLEPVTLRFHLNHEVGAKMPERLPAALAQFPNPALQRPGDIGRDSSTVGKHKTGGGVANDASSGFSRPSRRVRERSQGWRRQYRNG